MSIQLLHVFSSDVVCHIASFTVGLDDLACVKVRILEQYDFWIRCGVRVTCEQLTDQHLGALAVREGIDELKMKLLLRGARAYRSVFRLDRRSVYKIVKDHGTYAVWKKNVEPEDRDIARLVHQHSAVHAVDHFCSEMVKMYRDSSHRSRVLRLLKIALPSSRLSLSEHQIIDLLNGSCVDQILVEQLKHELVFTLVHSDALDFINMGQSYMNLCVDLIRLVKTCD